MFVDNDKRGNIMSLTIESFEKPIIKNSLRRTLKKFPSEIRVYSKSSINIYIGIYYHTINWLRILYDEETHFFTLLLFFT